MKILQQFRLSLAIGWGLFGFSGAALAGATQTLTPKQGSVSVLAEPKQDAKVLQELKEGESVEGGDRKGMYWEVKLSSGGTGYVSVTKVKRAQSGAASTTLSDALRSKVKEGREEDEVTNARTRSTVMGVRGLDESGDTAFAGNARPNLRMVYQMEDRKVDPKKMEELSNSVAAELESKTK